MKTQGIQALAAEVAKNIRTEQYINEFKQLLTKMTLEAAPMRTSATKSTKI